MNTANGSSPITRRTALSALFAGSAYALLPRHLEAAPRPDSPPRYALTDLGTLPGQTSSGANVINNRGQIGGWVSNGEQNFPGMMATQPVLWTDGRMRVLNAPNTPVFIYHNGKQHQLPGPYPFTEALTFASVTAINSRGDGLICAQFRSYEGNAQRSYATSWQLPETTYFWNAKHQRFYYVYDGGSARGLLEDGTVDRGHIQWHEGVEKAAVETPWPVYEQASANLSVERVTKGENSSKQPKPLGNVDGFPEAILSARNKKGQVLGQVSREIEPKAGTDYPQREIVPVFWEADGTPRILDQARIGPTAFTPQAINKYNDIVGATFAGTNIPCAHVYIRGKLFDLNSLVPPEVAREWKLVEARGINDRGEIVGNAKKGGYTRAFLLTPIATPR